MRRVSSFTATVNTLQQGRFQCSPLHTAAVSSKEAARILSFSFAWCNQHGSLFIKVTHSFQPQRHRQRGSLPAHSHCHARPCKTYPELKTQYGKQDLEIQGMLLSGLLSSW